MARQRRKEWLNDIHQGDAEDTLAELPESSVHMMMTSPPYYGLRDYGEDGQIGLEESLDEYIQELVDVFREVRRVLRPDGSAWLNLGDTYSGSGGAGGDWQKGDRGNQPKWQQGESPLRRKSKMLVPHRVAIALQEDGWIVRNDVTWVKPNPMPQSVKDRLNTATEQIFHLVPNPDYWYDLDAIREPHETSTKPRQIGGKGAQDGAASKQVRKDRDYSTSAHPAGKNPDDVFEVTTKPYPDAHFAVYPPELVEKPIKATCPPKVCGECGTPYERDVERETVYDHDTTAKTDLDRDRNDTDGGDGHDLRNGVYSSGTFKGWEKQCNCNTDETKPGIALDPFAGAGTTALVAKRQGRQFIGIDLNPEYVAMAQKRVGVTVDEPERLLEDGETALTEYATNGGR